MNVPQIMTRPRDGGNGISNWRKFSVFTKPSNSGVALVIVLGMLVLIVVLVIAFLSTVSTELKSAKSYANESDARALADSAVNIVISQIQDATTSSGTSGITGGPYSLAWASQPGMIRTYDDGGNAKMAYKLYSSGTMQVIGAYDPIKGLNSEIQSNWFSNPNMYTDLNKPVVATSGTGEVSHYPIIDPSSTGTSQSATVALSGTFTPIEGCFINSSIPGLTGSNPIPMPVQWLYTLKDGTIAAMDNVTQKVIGASGTNYVVGRIAFWADDESCKVNLNTAAEGTYWDRPFADGPTIGYERMLATAMPVQNEFQRCPGHPAMTSLSPIFPRQAGETAVQYTNRITDIIPRITSKDTTGAYGGSQSGTRTVTGTTKALLPDTDRLFANVDEFLFSGTTTGTNSRAVNLNSPGNGGSLNKFTQEDIERTRFFLTSSSCAPEVNLFNKPRVSLWPQQANTATISDPKNAPNRNATDKLLAACSTVGANPYYFQRYNTSTSPTQIPIASSQSPGVDWTEVPRNREIYTYLQNLTASSIPGLGGNFAGSKYSTATRDQILTEMMDYIRSEVNTFNTKTSPSYTYAPFPASSTNWVTGEGQVVPLVITPPGASYLTKGFGRFSTITQAAIVFYRTDKLGYQSGSPGSGPISGLSDSGTIAGKITVTEGPPPYSMGAVLILQTFNPTPGLPPWSGHVRHVVEGLSNITVNGTNLTFPDPAVNLVNAQEGYYDATALSGLEACFQYGLNPALGTKTLGAATVGAADEEKFYPLFASGIVFSGSTFNLNQGGPVQIKVKIYSGSSNPNQINPSDLVQTINMTFPTASNLPIPSVPFTQTYLSGSDQTVYTTKNSFTDYNARIATAGINEGFQHNPRPFIGNSDTVRSVQARYGGPALGDYRLIAGLADVPATYFEGHGLSDVSTDALKYTDTTVNSRLMHSLRVYVSVGNEQTGKSNGFYNNGNNATGMTIIAPKKGHGKLVSAATVLDPIASGGARPSRAPVAAQGMNGAYMVSGAPGDWDNGPGTQIDGPYINKADEGNSNVGYYNTGGNTTAGTIVELGSSYSPNRQICSAVAFGSLPSGIDPALPSNQKPWQTLLFCKNPASGSSHPGFGVPSNPGPPYNIPPDHAFLDLFTMPIVEPYAISEPFSTAGKINMNYQIVPFTYLTRDTGIRAVLKSTNIMAIPTTSGSIYKSGTSVDFTLSMPPDFRYTINPSEKDGTLFGFEQRFATGDIFRSASEICDLYLVPDKSVNGSQPGAGAAYQNMDVWWKSYQLTGDNVREAPYGQIYPRLTTKSNTFTVHVMTQSLKKALPASTPANDPRWGQWNEGKDQVTGEFRGSFVIQRYLDPNSDSLVHAADGKKPALENDADAMVGPYKFRVVSSKRFAP